ncbi:MAG: ATP-binding protein [Bacteroidota bacterium]
MNRAMKLENRKQKEAVNAASGYRMYLFLILAIILFVSGLSLELRYYRDRFDQGDVKHFERALHKREKISSRELDRIINESIGGSVGEVLDSINDNLGKLAGTKGLSFFYFENERLVYWSDHTIIISDIWLSKYEASFLELENCSYLTVRRNTDNGVLLALIAIKTSYPYENKFLESRFVRGFRLDPAVELRHGQKEGYYPVSDLSGSYLFSLDFSAATRHDRAKAFISFFCYVVAIILFILTLNQLILRRSGRRKWLWLFFSSLLVAATGSIMILFEIPKIIFETALFRPELYASRHFSSLGHLLIFVAVVLTITSLLHRHISREDFRNPRGGYIAAVLFLILSAAWFLFLNHLFSTLILDSNISFEAYQITSVDIYTFAGLLIIGLSFLAFVILVDKAVLVATPDFTPRVIRYGILITALVLLPFIFLEFSHLDIAGWVLFPLVVFGMIGLRNLRGELKFSRVLLLLFMFSVYATFQLQYYNRVDIDRKKEVELVKLSSEHDPVAEMLFSTLSETLRGDSVLTSMILERIPDNDAIYDYLMRKYLSGYWNRYEIQFTLCTPVDTVHVEPPVDEYYHCFEFFDDLVRENGFNIAGSDFYYLNNLTGRISYMAILPFISESFERNMFLEFDSKIISEELGYPELLLDKSYKSFTSSGFSYAKYYKGQLITRSGYPYRLSPGVYSTGKPGFENIRMGGYEHKVFNVNDESTIIVGSPEINYVDDLVAFSYIFGFFSILLIVFYFSVIFPGISELFTWSFKNRIQFSMAGILFLTFVFICGGTIYFIIRQYRSSHEDSLKETMRSIYIELLHKVEFEEDLGPMARSGYLDEQLRKFSNVFYTDINLYDRDGYLLATSRQEIFSKELLSKRMDRSAYLILGPGQASEYIHNEHIGSLDYLSAYVPLLNGQNKLLAYLNLPYFTRNDALAQDVTNLVVAVMNIYIVLILVILLVSVFLADRITQPLRMIQSRIAQVSLNMKNDRITYEREDEIKGLVKEYNHMVDELAASAERLAQSERESAWREMAKQIAHEIKNPLTPMKLTVQHLQRSWKLEGMEKQEAIDRITRTLIEQIDSLSSIANEFSDFAKMPRARNEEVNLPDVLENVVDLFSNIQNATVKLDADGRKELRIVADHEQLTRVFINLVKNGIQSVAEGQYGEILIRLKVVPESYAIVTVTDNGKGIPDEIRDKLFKPNFTTKSSGMGMGLAITSNIIRTIGGEIWYETVLNKGTTFFVKLPLYKK